jgi:small-conductance mechanosensitive channel
MTMTWIVRACLLAICLCLLPSAAIAQRTADGDLATSAPLFETSPLKRNIFGQATVLPRIALSSPRDAVRNLYEQSDAGNYEQAARSLDLRALSEEERQNVGPKLARRLHYILSSRISIDFEQIPGTPEGLTEEAKADGEAPRDSLLLARIPYENTRADIRLVRIERGGEPRWVFSQETVAQIDVLFRTMGLGFLTDFLPERIRLFTIFGIAIWQWLLFIVIAVVSWFISPLARWGVIRWSPKPHRLSRKEWSDRLRQFIGAPLRLFVFALLLYVLSNVFLGISQDSDVGDTLFAVLFIFLVLAFTWLVVRSVSLATNVYVIDYIQRVREHDALRARSLETQMTMLRRVANSMVVLIGLGIAVLQIDVFRTIGTSLLASAGLAGVILGLAAQRTLGNIFAGIQLAISQPVRIGDNVVFENEWGWIEEITYTYVVIRIWDLRRLVIPINYLLDRPIYNWTRNSPTLLGTVFLYLDYRMPIEPIRQELPRIAKTSEFYDKELDVCTVLVTNCTDRVIEVRALVSAPDAGSAWNLRCLVRERLIAFLQSYEGGRYLPRTRVQMEQDPGFQRRQSELMKQTTDLQSEKEFYEKQAEEVKEDRDQG